MKKGKKIRKNIIKRNITSFRGNSLDRVIFLRIPLKESQPIIYHYKF